MILLNIAISYLTYDMYSTFHCQKFLEVIFPNIPKGQIEVAIDKAFFMIRNNVFVKERILSYEEYQNEINSLFKA